ncbi:metal ABC transporter permease [Mobiluncus mulieris]|uniref:Metal ABC transporter permease n=1 Tax=Mobiluncus mulieris TaxID=2052 RepID=A0A7Y0YHR7_9ACTO|nr:metal ABC transporter permease [Mobiluncus mulieris]NMX03360.1 metal ABC transporter permease [Mobiluncus mulieris]
MNVLTYVPEWHLMNPAATTKTTDWLEAITDMWHQGFMVRGILVTGVAAAVCAVLSCWLILIGWSLLGDALSHAILPGIVVSYLLGAPFAIGALIAALVVVGLIGAVRGRGRVKEDTAIGVVFTTMFASGLVLISLFPSHIDLHHILFGDMLGITRADMWQVLILSPIALVVLLVKRQDLVLYAFDKTHAHTIGLSTQRLAAILLVCLSLTVVVAMQAVGAILIVALVITPGATARLLTSSFNRMLWVAPLVSVGCVVLGAYISYWFDTASGATVVALEGVLFLVVWGVDLLRRRSVS